MAAVEAELALDQKRDEVARGATADTKGDADDNPSRKNLHSRAGGARREANTEGAKHLQDSASKVAPSAGICREDNEGSTSESVFCRKYSGS